MGTTIAIDVPAIPINLSAGANVAIPITGQIDPITVFTPELSIPVNVVASATIIFTINIPFNGTLVVPPIGPIVVNPIVLNDLMVGANVQVPLQLGGPSRLNLTFPPLV
ncbi:hypothetical protein ACLILY_32395, partial [Mycobacterium sp. MS3]